VSSYLKAGELITHQLMQIDGNIAQYTNQHLAGVISELHNISPLKSPALLRLDLPRLRDTIGTDRLVVTALSIITDNDVDICRVREAIRRRVNVFCEFVPTLKLTRPQYEDGQLIFAVANLVGDDSLQKILQASINEMYTVGQEQVRTKGRQYAS
jgi:hypothetical protein